MIISEIIEKRHSKLPLLREKVLMIKNLSAALDMFDDFKSEIVDSQGVPIVGGRYDTVIAKNPEMIYNLNAISTEHCKNSIEQAKVTLDEAIKRFSRDSINISVVGHAKSGKSRFLQSVSNLPYTVISALDDFVYVRNVSLIEFDVRNSYYIESKEYLTGVISKSDATIFMLYPLHLGGGGITREIADAYCVISKKYNNKNLDKQIAWLINYAPEHPRVQTTAYGCEVALSTLEKNMWKGEMKKIIDVSNQKQVNEEFFIPFIEKLSTDLVEIDEQYLQCVSEAIESLKNEYIELFNKLNNVSSMCAAPLLQQYYRYFDVEKTVDINVKN